MSGSNHEQVLRRLTEWTGPTPGLWERALAHVDAEADTQADSVNTAVATIGSASWRRWGVGAVVAAAGLVLVIGVTLPSLGRARVSHPVAVNAERGSDSESAFLGGGRIEDSLTGQDLALFDFDVVGSAGLSESGGQHIVTPPAEPLADTARAVVRKVTIEITTGDIRAAVQLAQQVLSEPRGEYVESADIHEQDRERPRADLVLRVEAGRLPEVLTALRGLGEVTAERVDGEDVTEQMVDLDARLANERRVETELLELLETRENDSLEDILLARRELASVRERIERLAAQQQNLSRMVRLARVAVLLRGERVEEEAEPAQGLWVSFVDDLGEAWHDGVGLLLSTISGLVRVLVGGAVWFALAGTLLTIAWRKWRREHPRPLAE